MVFPLSHFCIIKLSYSVSSSLVKFKDALFLLYELKDEGALVLAFKSSFS